jgi:hypothetical protein
VKTDSSFPKFESQGDLALLTEDEIAAIAGGTVICYGPAP